MTGEDARVKRWTRIFLQVWAVIGVLLLVGAFGWLLGAVASALVPFALGLVIVLLLRRPVEWLVEKRLNRTVAVILCYVAAVLAVAVLLMFIVPPIYKQVADFIAAVPDYARRVYGLWEQVVVPRVGSGVPSWVQSAAVSLRDQVVAGAGQWSTALAATAVSTGSSIATAVVGFVLALIIGFYTLVDLPRLRDEIMLLAGPSARQEMVLVFTTVSRVLGGWLKGTLIQSVVVAVLFTILLSLLGVPYALAIGVLGGMLNVVPYVGPAITAILAGAAGLFVGPWVALWAVVAVFVVQQFDSLFMAPRIMSEQVDLHPLLVILSLLVGATLFGVPGMVLSVPVAAILKGLFVYWFERRTKRQICTDDGALFRTPKDERDDDDEPGPDGPERDPGPPESDTDSGEVAAGRPAS
jgi:predicted PurR-regulated permease PerM